MKSFQLFLLSLLSGLLFAFAWFPSGFTPLLFIAFVPLLLVESHIYHHPERYKSLTLFGLTYFTFFCWNLLTTWWIKNASLEGAAMIIVCNSLFMTTTFLLFHNAKKRTGEKWSALLFISFWLAFEYLHLDWDLTDPWLTLGYGFATNTSWIQWYEYTGVAGGSLWVLLVNVLIFKIVSSTFKVQRSNPKTMGFNGWELVAVLSLLIAPILLSNLIVGKEIKSIGTCNVVVVQPNIDPYNEKFTGNYLEQLQQMLALADKKVNNETDYVLFPETALTETIWENDLQKSGSIELLKTYVKQHPQLKIIIGASTFKFYKPGEEPSETARTFSDNDEYYDAYNTALQIDSSNIIQIYHKSKLVAGVEKIPFPFIFKNLESIALDLGGTTGSLGTQKERTVFSSPDKKIKTAPVICYESVYGEFVGEYVKHGATFISVITNDGWWGDTPGYKQHLKYGALRAIETRRWIARSANTGISCFINPQGELVQASKWWEPAVMEQKITLNNKQTFYTTYGDYVSRIALYVSLIMLIYSVLIRFQIIKK